jgi:ubiquinone/menaquinone biosynthesis C-methylase UbiE
MHNNYSPRIIISLVLLVGLYGLMPAHSQESERDHHYTPGQFEKDSRDQWQKVDDVIKAFGLKKGQSIADIGGGSGYFTRSFAKTVGPEGIVYCCDLATNLLEFLQDQSKEEGLKNIITVYAAMDRPMLPPKSLDHIFFCNTNHHLSNRVEYYKGLIPLLRQDGQLVVVDWKKKKQKIGPPPSHNHSQEMLTKEMGEAGWKLVREIKDVLDYQYFLIFKLVK